MRRLLLSATAFFALPCLLFAQGYGLDDVNSSCAVEFDKIQYWAGEGENRAALVVQFNDDKDERAFVWGYRWNGTASGEDMLRAVARQSKVLTALVQYTGSMGSTLDGLGLSASREDFASYLVYDFEEACNASAFDFYNPNSMLGQEEVPGDNAPEMVAAAIANSVESGIIEHPINARRYGYPSYDYDCWQLDDDVTDYPEYRWQAGWYEGYWSYWVGGDGDENLSYSGLGMSSRQLVNGAVDWWNFIPDMKNSDPRDLTEELDYEFSDFEEEMKPYVAPVYPLDFEKLAYTVGSGEKYCSLVFRFGDGKGPDNLAYEYRWSGGWDDRMKDIVKAISASDNRLTVTQDNGGLVTGVRFDSDGDGEITERDHDLDDGQWDVFCYYANEPECMKLKNWNYANPRAVMVVTHRDADTGSSYPELPYTLYRPASGYQGFALPEAMQVRISDEDALIPAFAQFTEMPEAGWSVSGENAGGLEIHGDVTGGYLSFITPAAGEVEVVLSGRQENTLQRAPGQAAVSRIEVLAPERPVTSLAFGNDAISMEPNSSAECLLTVTPSDATFTKVTYTSSNPEIVSVDREGKITSGAAEGTATITASYNYDPSVKATTLVTVDDTTGVGDCILNDSQAAISVNSNIITFRHLTGCTVSILDISGHTIDKFNVCDDDMRVCLNLAPGLYIIKTDNINTINTKIFIL